MPQIKVPVVEVPPAKAAGGDDAAARRIAELEAALAAAADRIARVEEALGEAVAPFLLALPRVEPLLPSPNASI